MNELQDYLDVSRERHNHLCPRQVLGTRIALAGLSLLGIDASLKARPRLLVISETDGCFVDGIEVTARVSAGHRSLKIEDYGKIAATFVDLKTQRAVRLTPAAGVRELARTYFPLEKRAYFAQLKGYQVIPDGDLLRIEWVTLTRDLRQIVGSPRQRACCSRCGEDIINGREVRSDDAIMCMACAGHVYYRPGKGPAQLDRDANLISVRSTPD